MAIPAQAKDPLKLCPCVRQKYLDMVDIAKSEGIPLILIETIREPERQRYYIKIGVSQTMKSYHLPQPPKGLALAFDIVPKAYTHEPRWFPAGPLWDDMARIGIGIGLKWGGGWSRFKDKPHFYLEKCECQP